MSYSVISTIVFMTLLFIGITFLKATTATRLTELTVEEPFMCPDFDCDSAECHHMERSGLCEDVINGTFEVTRDNCGCCFLCNDKIGKKCLFV